MHITVKILPPATGPANPHLQLPGRGIISFTVLAKPEQTFLSVWSEIERIYARNYIPPGQRSNFQIKKLQNVHGADIDLEFTVGDFFEGETAAKIIQVVQAPIDRETSVLVTSNLRPHLHDFNKRKRVLEEQEETRKRRKREEDQYGQALENLDPDRPLRSSEGYVPDGNTFAIPESPNHSGQKARLLLDDHGEEFVIQDSQPNGQMEDMNEHVKEHPYGQDIVDQETMQFRPGHAAEHNPSPSMSPELGDQDFEPTAAVAAPVFKKPTLTASGRRIGKASARRSPLSAAGAERAPSSPRNPYAPAVYDMPDKDPPVIPQSNIPQPRAERTNVYDEIGILDAEPRERDNNQLHSARAIEKRGELPAEALKMEASRPQNAKRLKLGPSTGPSSRNRHPLLQQYTSASTPKVNGALNGHHTPDLVNPGVATHADATTGPQATPPAVPLGEPSKNSRSSPMTSAEKLQRLRERRASTDDDRHVKIPQERRGDSNSISGGNGVVARPGQTESRSNKPGVSAYHDHQGFVGPDGELSDEVDDEAYEEASRQIEQLLDEQIEAQSEDDVPEQTTATTSFSKKPVGPKRVVARNRQRATAVNDQVKSAVKAPRKWTSEEDQILLAARTRGDPWLSVVAGLPGRTIDMCRKRYTRLSQAAPATELQQPDLQQWLGSDPPDQAGEGSSQKRAGSIAKRHDLNGSVVDKTTGVNAGTQKKAKQQKAARPAKKSQDNISAKAAGARALHEHTGLARSTSIAAQNPNKVMSKDEVGSVATDEAPHDKRLTGGDVRDLLAILAERKAHRISSSQSIPEDARAAHDLSTSKHTPQQAIPPSRKVVSRPRAKDDIVRSPEDKRMPNASGRSSGSVDGAGQQQDENELEYVDEYAVNDEPHDAGVEGSNEEPSTAPDPHLENGFEIEESEAGYADGKTAATGTIADEPPTANQVEGEHGLGTQSNEYELPALFDNDLRYFASQSTAAERDMLPSPAASGSDRSPARYVSASPDAERQSSSEGEVDSSGQGGAEIRDERQPLGGGQPDRVALKEDGQEDGIRKKAAKPPTNQSVNHTSGVPLVNGDSHGSKSGQGEPAEPRPRNAARDSNAIATAGRQVLIDDEAEEASESSSEEESADEESEGGDGASSEDEEQGAEETTARLAPAASHKPRPSTAAASKVTERAAAKQPPPPPPQRSRPEPSFTASDTQHPGREAAKDPSPPSSRRSPRTAMRSPIASEPASSVPASTPATSQATVHTQPKTTNQRALPPVKATLSSRNSQSVSRNRPTTPPPAQSTPDSQLRRSPRLNGALPSQGTDQLQTKPAPRPTSAASKFPSSLSELKSRHSTPLTGGLTASPRASLASSRQFHTVTGVGKTHSVARRTTISTATTTTGAGKSKSKSDSESSSSGESSEDDDEEEEEQIVLEGKNGKKGGVNGVSRSSDAEKERGQKNRYQGLMKSMYNLIGSPFSLSGT